MDSPSELSVFLRFQVQNLKISQVNMWTHQTSDIR
uniref:Uncharacterized protein n=1 Tax=Anguilla anguilla TaxID=7936 RepID=A0A0E9RQL4_ANGAN